VHLVHFITNESVTMHGHINVKYLLAVKQLWNNRCVALRPPSLQRSAKTSIPPMKVNCPNPP